MKYDVIYVYIYMYSLIFYIKLLNYREKNNTRRTKRAGGLKRTFLKKIKLNDAFCVI